MSKKQPLTRKQKRLLKKRRRRRILFGIEIVILLILIIGGFLMLSLGIIGHYIARIYEEVKGRPKYIIRRVTENVAGNVVGSWKKR